MIGPKSISNSSNNNDNNGNSINDNDNNDIFSQQNSITNFACRHVRTLVPSFPSSSLPSSSSSLLSSSSSISADRCRRCHFWGRLTSRQESFLLSNPERIEMKKKVKMIFFIAAGDFCKRCESGSMSVGGADDDVIVVELIGKKKSNTRFETLRNLFLSCHNKSF